MPPASSHATAITTAKTKLKPAPRTATGSETPEIFPSGTCLEEGEFLEEFVYEAV